MPQGCYHASNTCGVHLTELKLTHYQSLQNSCQEYAQDSMLEETKLEMRTIPLSFFMPFKR